MAITPLSYTCSKCNRVAIKGSREQTRDFVFSDICVGCNITTAQKPIEKILKYLPCLAIKDLSIIALCNCEDSLEWNMNNEHTRECEESLYKRAAALSEITGEGVWCNGYSDTLLDYTPQTVFEWLNDLKGYFGDFTCTIYFEDKQGNYYEAQKDTMNSAEDVIRDLYDQVTPF